MSDNRTLLLAKGWKRHTFISISDSEIEGLLTALPKKLHEHLKTPNAKVLLATYDCAVISESFDDEPWVQILIALPVDYDKQFASGRNSRRIHFFIELNNANLAYEVNAMSICQIERELLLNLNREENITLTPESAFDLKNWISERFRQDAWPDAFNTALVPANKRLKSFWKRYKDFITGLYLKPNTFDEITSGKYRVSIIASVEAGKELSFIEHLRKKDSSLAGKNVSAAKNKIVSEIKTAFGDTIEYEKDPTSYSGDAIEVLSEEEMTVAQLRHFPRYSPYSLSLYEGDSSLPVEMIAGKSTD